MTCVHELDSTSQQKASMKGEADRGSGPLLAQMAGAASLLSAEPEHRTTLHSLRQSNAVWIRLALRQHVISELYMP